MNPSQMELIRMVSTLQELCYQRLTSTMMGAPPGLQEAIVGETRRRMEVRVRKELWVKEWKDNTRMFADLVPQIMEDLIRIIVTPGVLRPNYVAMFAHIHPCIVQFAVSAAEEAVRRMEERYVHAAFAIRATSEDDSDGESEYPDSEGMYM